MPNTSRPTRPATSAPAHIGQGSRVTTRVTGVEGRRTVIWCCFASIRARVLSTENRGLATARNLGLETARGKIVAYLDSDAYPDRDWLKHLTATLREGEHAGVGGPNIPPEDDGWVADCVAYSPGGPIHVLLSDRVAEHVPSGLVVHRDVDVEA